MLCRLFPNGKGYDISDKLHRLLNSFVFFFFFRCESDVINHQSKRLRPHGALSIKLKNRYPKSQTIEAEEDGWLLQLHLF